MPNPESPPGTTGGAPRSPRSPRSPRPQDRAGDEIVLAELVSRVLDRGVVVAGDVILSVAGIDLVHLGLLLRLSSIETLASMEAARIPAARPSQPESSAALPPEEAQ